MSGIFTQPVLPNRRLVAQGRPDLFASTGTVWDAAAEETSLTNPAGIMARGQRRHLAYIQAQAAEEGGFWARPAKGPARWIAYGPSRTTERFIEPDEANERFGVAGELAFDRRIPQSVAADLYALKQGELRRREIFARAQGGVVETLGIFAVMLAVSATDPLNVASAFLPVVGPARLAIWAERYGRTSARAFAGAIEGAAGAAALEPLIYVGRTAEQADYDAVDSLLNVAVGSALGGGLHVGVGAAADWRVHRRARTFLEGLGELDQGGIAARIEALPVDARDRVLRAALADLVERGQVDRAEAILDLHEAADWQRVLEAPDQTGEQGGDRLGAPTPPRGELPPRRAWPAGFPNVFVHQRSPHGKSLVNHPRYTAAKAGDPEAAFEVARDLIDDKTIDAIRGQLGDRRPIVAFVHAEEAAGRNAIPVAFAREFARRLGLELESDIVQINRSFHTHAAARDRFVSRAEFDGPVAAGRDYLILDDVVTAGGTLADLRAHIEAKGGQVIGASTLIAARFSEILAPRPGELAALKARHGELEDLIRQIKGAGFEGLTNSEAHWLGTIKSPDAARNRILAAEQPGRDSLFRPPPRGGRGEGGGEGGGQGPQGPVTPPGLAEDTAALQTDLAEAEALVARARSAGLIADNDPDLAAATALADNGEEIARAYGAAAFCMSRRVE